MVHRTGADNVVTLATSPLTPLVFGSSALLFFALMRPGGGLKRLFGLYPPVRGAVAGMWTCQVTGAADAERQEPILRAIIECELHERIFQGTWRVVPAFAGQDAGTAT